VISLYELGVAPLAFCLAALHVVRAVGALRALVELLALVVYGFALEATAMAVFASHRYSEGWRVVLWGVPLAVAVMWGALIVSVLAVAGRLHLDSAVARGGAAALLGVAVDLGMEPVAVSSALWEWTPRGVWLGVPVGNFVGWAIIVGTYAFGAEAFHGSRSLAVLAARRTAVAVGALGALVAVGVAWRTTGAEGFFSEGGGWGIWALLLLATTALRSRHGGLPGPTLAGRLAAPGTAVPGAVLLLVATVFAADGWRGGTDAVALAACGPLVALALVLPSVVPVGLVDRWRLGARRVLAGGDGLLQVLMKPRNGQPWTPEERAFLRAKMRDAARWTPAFLLLLLPGSVLLLPAYAWFLDRRRARRTS
jgi:hypothetical protein